MPLLADFGLAFKTPPGDIHNPRWYNRGAGTPGFLSPEHTRWVNPEDMTPVNRWRLGDRTNVYGVGLILWCLVNRNFTPPQPLWLGQGEHDQTLALPHLVNHPLSRYSPELKDLIGDCLRFRIDRRPSFHGLLRTINDNTSEGDNRPNRALGMRSGTADFPTRGISRIIVQEDNYKVGMARDEIVGEDDDDDEDDN